LLHVGTGKVIELFAKETAGRRYASPSTSTISSSLSLRSIEYERHLTTRACQPLSKSDFSDVVITSAAELPGLVTLLMIEFFGRKKDESSSYPLRLA
jgi:hypothetical protein